MTWLAITLTKREISNVILNLSIRTRPVLTRSQVAIAFFTTGTDALLTCGTTVQQYIASASLPYRDEDDTLRQYHAAFDHNRNQHCWRI